jgi:hypothetical protein
MFKLENVLFLILNLPQALMALQEIKEVVEEIIKTFGEDDQEKLQAAIREVAADNDRRIAENNSEA